MPSSRRLTTPCRMLSMSRTMPKMWHNWLAFSPSSSRAPTQSSTIIRNAFYSTICPTTLLMAKILGMQTPTLRTPMTAPEHDVRKLTSEQTCCDLMPRPQAASD